MKQIVAIVTCEDVDEDAVKESLSEWYFGHRIGMDGLQIGTVNAQKCGDM